MRSRYISTNPAEGVALPRATKREMRYLESAEIVKIAQAVPDRYESLVYVLAYGGLRWAEAVGLRRSRCVLLRSRLEITETLSEVAGQLHRVPPKNRRGREVTLPAFLRDMVAAHIARFVDDDPDTLVFTTSTGTPLRSPNFRRNVWLPAIRATGNEGLRLHDLRHTAASLLISEGAHPRAVMEHLGHSSIRVSMDVYGHLFPSDMEDLAARLDARHRAVT